jgi:YggT family protein
LLSNALIYLIDTAATLFTVALLVRFYMQWARSPYRNPLSVFVVALTDFVVRPARRLIPGFWGFDMATLFIAWLIQLVELAIVHSLMGHAFGPQAGLVFVVLGLLAILMLIKLMLYIVMFTVIVQAVLSLINPYSPFAPLINSLARPFVRPFQRLVPPVGGFDLSPLFVVVVCQLLLMVPVAYLQAAIGRLL